MAIFEQMVEQMAQIPELDEQLKYMQAAKKQEGDRYDQVIDDLKISKLQMQQSERFAQNGSIGEAVVTGEDSFENAFSNPQPLT